MALRSLSYAHGVRSSLVVDWLRHFDTELHARYPTLTSAKEFHDQLTAYVRKTAPQKESSLRAART